MKHLQLTIYVNQADMIGDVPLYEDLVRRLLHFEVSGVTVTRGLMGFGKHGKWHRKRLFGVSDDSPIVITAVEEETRLRAILTEIRAVVTEGLITLHEVEVV